VTQALRDAPAGGLDAVSVADPAQVFLDPPSDGGREARGLEFGERVGLGIGEAATGALEDGLSAGL
jgi:hypothetical protein